jgi:chromosome segregation ATPase
MGVDFSNAYQEILLDNLMAVIKQNFIFQTQIKLTEDVSRQKQELEEKYNELNNRYNSIKDDAEQVKNYKLKAEQNNSAHEEKNRIQSALNDSMKKNSALQKELEDKTSVLKKELTEKEEKIKSLENYVKVLEENVAVTKLKKINSNKTVELPLEKDGSSF